MEDEDFYLEDWKMTKDRIAHFDNKILTVRLQGIPIATGIQAAGIGLSGYLSEMTSPLPLFSLIMAISVLYIIPVFLLDIYNLKLLMLSVKHALDLETQLQKKLSITHSLTSDKLSALNKIGGAAVYLVIIVVGIGLAIYGLQNPQILTTG